MQIIKWANGEGQKLILSEEEAEELMEAIKRAIIGFRGKGEYGSFEIEIEE